MAEEKYDPYEGFYRVASAAENLNMEAVEVVTLHLALEREIEIVLSKMLARTDKLIRLGFLNKAAVLHSTWRDSANADKLYEVLNAFNELRNAFAHGNSGIDTCRRNLIAAYRSIDPSATEPIAHTTIAQGVCALMGGGTMPGEFQKIADGLTKLVNEALPTVMGKKIT